MENRPEQETPVLIAQSGPLEGQRWNIDRDLLIGRDGDCDVIVITPDKQVSRRHARISLRNGEVQLTDLDSKNGTYLNSSRVAGSAELQDGDSIQIALAQQFVFLSSDATVPLDADGLESQLQVEKRLVLDKKARRVFVDGQELSPPLSVAQFTMLELLYEADGDVVTRYELIAAVWGKDQAYEVSNQALDALVRRLRDRLTEIQPDFNFIVTVRGHGLRLDNPKT